MYVFLHPEHYPLEGELRNTDGGTYLALVSILFAGFALGMITRQLTEPYRSIWKESFFDSVISVSGKSVPDSLAETLKKDDSERVGMAVVTNKGIYASVRGKYGASGLKMLVAITGKDGEIYAKNW